MAEINLLSWVKQGNCKLPNEVPEQGDTSGKLPFVPEMHLPTTRGCKISTNRPFPQDYMDTTDARAEQNLQDAGITAFFFDYSTQARLLCLLSVSLPGLVTHRSIQHFER